jgi:glycosyltransferase involved in cell wall biosynthesis
MLFRGHNSKKRFLLLKQMNEIKKKQAIDNKTKQKELTQKELNVDEWKAWKQETDALLEAKESHTNETLTQLKYEEWRLEEEKREKERVEKERARMEKEDKETKDKIRQEKEIIRKAKYEEHKRLMAQKKEAMEVERARANHERQLMTEEDNIGKAIVRKEKERIWRIKKEEWRKQRAIEQRERMKKQHELMMKRMEERRLRTRQKVSFQMSSFGGSIPKPVASVVPEPVASVVPKPQKEQVIQEIEEDVFIKNIVVVSTPVIKDNHDIEHHMRSLGFNVNTIYHYPKDINNKTIYIFLYFYPTIRYHQYPKYYIIWQIEQLCASNQVMNVLTQEKVKIMKGALQIYEISMKHYNTMYSEQIPRNKIYYCPLPFYHSDQIMETNLVVAKDLDCVFIGSKNARRNHILSYLQQELEKRNITLHIYYGIFGDEKINILKRAKYILNIHYYDNASLETHRINEALHYNCITLSEDVVDESDDSTKNAYANTVLFNPIIEEDDTHLDIYVDSIEGNLKAETYHENIESIHIHKETLSEYFSKLTKENAFACDKLIDLNVKNKISNKDDFRHICNCNLPLIRNILIPDIPNECHYEAFYIEFRQFTHAEFLIRNAVIKLPQWAHTVICGNKNFESLSKICKSISPHITVLKLDIDNLNTAEYSRLLLTKEFWNQFKGEKLLLYQEDSFLFHNQIEPFLEYDYIGAPWPIHQDENIDQKKYGVGNGGFSLRSKSKMIECIDKIDWQKDLELGPRLKRYMIATNNYIIPEDVYFSKALLEKGIGYVAPRDVAVHFSQETQQSINPLGGHNFFLANKSNIPCLSRNIGLLKTTNRVGFYSSVPFIRGGGEKYLSDLISFFLDLGYKVYFFNYTRMAEMNETFKLYSIDPERIRKHKPSYLNTILQWRKTFFFDYFIEMSNSLCPDLHNHINKRKYDIKEISYKHIYHCQFPENVRSLDVREKIDNNQIKYINKVIVNSEYTFKYLYPYYQEKLKILYPLCYLESGEGDSNIEKNDDCIHFVTIGRLFRYIKTTNCKNIDIMIDVFHNLSALNELNFKFHIICSVKDFEYYKYLLKRFDRLIRANQVIFYPDCSDEVKEYILMKSDYYIHATGIRNVKGSRPSEEEHFGISVIESISKKCIPIVANRGFPPYLVTHNENGYVFDTIDELKNIIYDLLFHERIITKQLDIAQVSESNSIIANQYSNILFYKSNFLKILFNA